MNREDFPMLKEELVYLDNAATTLKPQIVIDSICDYYTNYSVNAYRGNYSLSYKVDLEFEKARDDIAKFIGAKTEEIIFTSGTTASLNMIVSGFFDHIVEPGDEIIISKAEHASNVLPWFRLANKHNLKIVYAPIDANMHITLEGIKSVITPKTKVIALAEITNVIGDVRPIKEISKIAHENNIFVVVDGAQSVPHKKTDVKDLDVDFLVFSGHKMCGPTGIGVLYGKKELLEEIDPLYLGGGMNESYENEKQMLLKDIPHRLEAGTPHIAGVIGLGAAVNYLNEIGMDNIYAHEIKLKQYLIDKLNSLGYINIINDEEGSGIVSFNVDGIFAEDVSYYLNKYNICVRSGNHCAKNLKDIIGVRNTVRVSLYFYNTQEDIDDLIEALRNKDNILKEVLE